MTNDNNFFSINSTKKSQHSYRFLIKSSVLITSFLGIFLFNVTTAEPQYYDESKNGNGSNQSCKNLQKVNNLDELLYQFHILLDDSCLLSTPVETLEKSWGVRILDLSKLEAFGQSQPKKEEELLNKLIKLKESYISQQKNSSRPLSSYLITKNCFEKNDLCYFDITAPVDFLVKQKSLLENNKFPQSLQNPRIHSKHGFKIVRNKKIYYYDTGVMDMKTAKQLEKKERFRVEKNISDIHNSVPMSSSIYKNSSGSIISTLESKLISKRSGDEHYTTYYHVKEKDEFDQIKAPTGDFDCEYKPFSRVSLYPGYCDMKDYIWEANNGRIKIKLEDNYGVRNIRVVIVHK